MLEPATRPPIAQAPVSVILLAERDAAATTAAVAGWRSFLACLDRPTEILLVRPTQPDVTDALGTAFRTFRYDSAEGYGPVLQAAILAARHPLLAFATADGQYQPQDLGRMLAVIDQVDLVQGFRVHRPVPLWRTGLDRVQGLLLRVLLGVTPEPRRHWPGRAGWRRRWLARWVFGLRLHDPECVFRLCRRTVFDRLPLQSRGPFVWVELLAKANHLECMLAEEPVTWTPLAATEEAISFRHEAMALFRSPEFRPPPAPSSGPPASSEPAADPASEIAVNP